MTDKLPPNLLQLFAPRPALRYTAPTDFAPEQRITPAIDGVADYLSALKDYDDGYVPTESWLQKHDRIKLEKKKTQEYIKAEGFTKEFKPDEDPEIKGDPLRTLFIARLSYDATENDLEKEFARFGPIERVRCLLRILPGHQLTSPCTDPDRHRQNCSKGRHEEAEAQRLCFHCI